ncbi:MAG: tetratricopeptide repeat protein, partial [Candidatus Aminicenantes bacterium]|nr:tetratricopeptide repeat protein [Candidatus Aminicenantes bacterium]
LNNISQVYSARGDLDTALQYSEKDLKICRDLGDKSGTCYTLHNMAAIAHAKDDMKTFMEYEGEALRLALEINDAMGVYTIGKNFGAFLTQSGAKEAVEMGVTMLERSLQIGKKAGFPDVGQIEEILRQVKKKN